MGLKKNYGNRDSKFASFFRNLCIRARRVLPAGIKMPTTRPAARPLSSKKIAVRRGGKRCRNSPTLRIHAFSERICADGQTNSQPKSKVLRRGSLKRERSSDRDMADYEYLHYLTNSSDSRFDPAHAPGADTRCSLAPVTPCHLWTIINMRWIKARLPGD